MTSLGSSPATLPVPAPGSSGSPGTSSADAAALAAMCVLLTRTDVAERMKALVRRCGARLTLAGFEPSHALEVSMQALGTDACALVVSQQHASGAACGLLLRARLLLMARAVSWGRGFLHLELSREGVPVLPLPGPEQLFVQRELGKRAVQAVPHGPESEASCAQELLSWLDTLKEAFDAPAFAQQVIDALAH